MAWSLKCILHVDVDSISVAKVLRISNNGNFFLLKFVKTKKNRTRSKSHAIYWLLKQKLCPSHNDMQLPPRLLGDNRINHYAVYNAK
jgi:hypothetical protein